MDRTESDGRSSSGLDDGLFDLIGYLLTSARSLLDEPAEYGPFRLVESVSRLSGLMTDNGSPRQAFLTRLRDMIDAGKFTVMSDMNAFTTLLDQTVQEFTRQMKND
jgi:hypothetical protein